MGKEKRKSVPGMVMRDSNMGGLKSGQETRENETDTNRERQEMRQKDLRRCHFGGPDLLALDLDLIENFPKYDF